MEVKYTTHFLHKLEDIFAESDFALRYEKGSFKSGYCVLNDTKVVIVNKYYSLEGKVNCLIDIIRTITLDVAGLRDKSKELLKEIQE